MATLIPAIGSCVSRMTSGERRTAERLEQKLDDDYLLWYDVAVGPKHLHPDFVVMHPRRGILILEVKDFRLSTLIQANKQTWVIHGDLGPKTIPNPLEQARQYAHQVVNALERDPQLATPEGPHQGKLAFPWSYGVVLSNITRAQFDKAELGHAIEPHRVVCQDEMGEHVEPEELQCRLWDMFPFMMGGVMSLPQMDRVRWIMFPEVRVQTQDTLFDDSDEAAELPSIMRVMDLQQEQLARSLGDGHRVIHGVAGSGKTMLLGYRAEHLAKAQTAASKPILILCYNEPLGVKLAASMGADLTINSRSEDAAKIVQEKTGGAHAAVVTAVAKAAFNSAVDAVRAGGRVVAVGLPPEAMSLDIPRLVLDGIQVVGSLVGTRQDLQEAFQFAAEGKVVPKVTMRPIEDINAIFKEMEQGQIRGRMVIDLRS